MIDESEVGFVDEGGGLEGEVGAFVAHLLAGEAAELLIDGGEEGFGGGGVTAAREVDEARNVGRRIGIQRGWGCFDGHRFCRSEWVAGSQDVTGP